MVFTNHGKIEGTDLHTGWYLPECAHPYIRFAKAGYEIDFASILGGLCPVTPSSLTLQDSENDEFWGNPILRAKTESTLRLQDCDPVNYDLLFFVGGFGTMWDFPFDSTLAKFTQDLYEQGGVIGAVCHGPIALMNVKLSDNQYLLYGRKVTAFSNEEEASSRLLNYLPEHNGLGRTCEDIFRARGAKYSKTEPWGKNIVVSDRIFTGQNPASAGPLADAIIAKIKTL